MKVIVLLSSGDTDDWDDVADAVLDQGALVVLSHTEDEIPDDSKTMEIIEQNKTTTYFVDAVYAPGMWMKVEYDF